ncbi:hypothetical protein KXR87_18610 [Yokenella regensburgei]|uniref:hypothetical protein n=1 Tax=Yokenella regensburgei TaxID=158877 RepID=UPI003F13FA39
MAVGASLDNVPGPGDTSHAGYVIYPTNISGIGISVNSQDAAGTPPIPVWPDVLVVNTVMANGMNRIFSQNVAIRLWKIPGDISVGTSPFAVTGPMILQGIMPAAAGDTLDPAMMTADRALSSTFWTLSSRNLVGSANYYVGTCNLSDNNQTVLLGKHLNFERYSAWKDASFSIECPSPAYGYGGVNGTTANKRNKPPSINITPYNAEITHDDLGNTLSSTIALDAGGAQGYGVQLAWGDYSTQAAGVNPAQPVPFNTRVSVASLVAGYPTLISPLGSTAKPATIKMAARFIQTEAVPQPGPARAAVEVIVNYE